MPIAALLLTIALTASSVLAQERSVRDGTAVSHGWRSESAGRQIGSLPEVTTSGNVILVPNDDTIAPFLRPFNLQGRSITFTPHGVDDFSSITGALEFEEEMGALQTLDPQTLSAPYSIEGFDFPFFGSNRRALHIGRHLAIYLTPAPRPATFRQYEDAELALMNAPVIAPLLTTVPGQSNFRPPAVYVKETPGRVVITWFEATRPLAIQAVLFQDGRIRFSYRSIGNTRGGAVVITSGTESWRTFVPIGGSSDPPSDFATSNPPDIAAMLDIGRVDAGRIGQTNIIQFIIQTREPIDRTKIGPGRSIGISIWLAPSSSVQAQISGDGASADQLSSPRYSVRGATPLLRIEGKIITISMAQEHALREEASDSTLTFSLANQFGGDTATALARIGPAARHVRTDFGAIDAVPSFAGPITDAFVIPRSDVFAAWEKVKVRFGLDPETIDGVVVYQNFQTEGTAVSSVGNAGVDHISIGTSISSALPREPNLIDMHAVDELWNARDQSAVSVLMHEWGHRWLFFLEHLENGVTTRILNDGGHPAAFVDTRAAFPIVSEFDCSVMGGYTFRDNGDGTFTGPPDTCAEGYSWLDLYLMGLAAPHEVPEFFYLTEIDPPLDELPFVETQTFRARRNGVSIGDVIARMGTRAPAFPNTQREFRVIFVLVYDPAALLPADDVERVAHLAGLFRERFARATGGRGSVITTFSPTTRRRPAQR